MGWPKHLTHFTQNLKTLTTKWRLVLSYTSCSIKGGIRKESWRCYTWNNRWEILLAWLCGDSKGVLLGSSKFLLGFGVNVSPPFSAQGTLLFCFIFDRHKNKTPIYVYNENEEEIRYCCISILKFRCYGSCSKVVRDVTRGWIQYRVEVWFRHRSGVPRGIFCSCSCCGFDLSS